jgi:hypothetical protein
MFGDAPQVRLGLGWVLVSAAAIVGCKKSDSEGAATAGYTQGQTQPGQVQPGQTDPTQPGQPQPGQVQPGQTDPTQPGQVQPGQTTTDPTQPGQVQPGQTTPDQTVTNPTPGTPQPVQPLDITAAAVVQPILNELAKKETQPGAKAVGAAMVGNFPTNGVLETQVQLQPNKCYTVVATSLPPVAEVNIQLVAVAPLPGLAPVLATDMDTGPNAVLGRKPNCYKWALPLPAPAKVVLQVPAGSGLVAAQLYEK